MNIPQDIKTTYHMFYSQCDSETKLYFDKVNQQICPVGYIPVVEMNEFYVTKNKGEGSDLVFETPHVDGPFFFIPGILLRCIYVVKGDTSVITHIPKKHYAKSLETNEYCMFDYHRDVHYIEIKERKAIERVVLKLHFIQKNYIILKYFSIIYNTIARYLFIKSLQKNKLSVIINYITNVYTKLIT